MVLTTWVRWQLTNHAVTIGDYQAHPAAGSIAFGTGTVVGSGQLGLIRIVHVHGNEGMRGEMPAPFEEWSVHVPYIDVLDPLDGYDHTVDGQGLSLQAALDDLSDKLARIKLWIDQLQDL